MQNTTAIKIKYMRGAIAQAERAAQELEVPVGCVIVKDNKVIARAHNLRESLQDATAHAEIIAIKKACKKLGTFRLSDCDLYVTLEPCPMCAGAIINARIKAVYFGAYDKKAGCCGTLYSLNADKRFNHNYIAEGGIMQQECAELLSSFFADRRKNGKTLRHMP